jgi:hypothetical protein
MQTAASILLCTFVLGVQSDIKKKKKKQDKEKEKEKVSYRYCKNQGPESHICSPSPCELPPFPYYVMF